MKAVGLSENMPNIVKQALIQKLYSEDTKQGDRDSIERYVGIFNEVMQSFGFRPR